MLLAVGSAFFGAIASLLARTLLTDLKSKDIVGINFLAMAMILVLFSPVFYEFEASMIAMILIAVMSLIDTLANYFYFKTFEKTEASIATPILSLAPGVTFLLGWMLIEDSVDLQSFLLAILIIASVVVFSIDFKNFSVFKKETLLPAVASFVLFGVSAIPAKILLDTMGVINSPTLYMFRSGFIALFSLLIFRFTIPALRVQQFRFICFRAVFVIFQWLLLYYALTLGSAGITTTLGNITPIFVFILSIIFLKEKITFKKILTATLVLGLSFLLIM
jgi:drug/metabolite transporter (DMT)-like permease